MTIDKNTRNEEEVTKAIEVLRQRFEGSCEPELEDNHFLKKFLAARDFNIDNAEIMLRKHLEFRKKYDVTNIVKKYKIPEVYEKYVTYKIIGHDKEGCVVRYCNAGNLDLCGILLSVKHEDVAKLIIYEQELEEMELKKKSKELGRIVDKVIYIIDIGNLSFAQVTDKKVIYGFLFLMQIYINNYPEKLKAAFALNASVYFTFLYSLMKTVLPSTILDKIHIYSDDSYKEKLLKMIDADTLPVFLGGNKTDPDGSPLCNSLINEAGRKIPESYYIRKNKLPLSKTKGVGKVTLSRAAFHEVKLDVKEPGSYLEWEFETKCRDIGFGLFYQEIVDGEEKITELISIQRIDTEEYPETGTFRCENPGTYVIVFDNTYSWIRAKEIYYRTKIILPREQEAELEGS